MTGCHKRISTLLQSRNGGLWIAMDYGPVLYLNNGTTQVFTNGFPNELASGLAEEGDNTLWIAYRGGNVCRLRNGNVTQSSPHSAIRSPARGTHGRVWFPTGGAIGMFRDGRFEKLQLPAPTICLIAEVTVIGLLADSAPQWPAGTGRSARGSAFPGVSAAAVFLERMAYGRSGSFVDINLRVWPNELREPR